MTNTATSHNVSGVCEWFDNFIIYEKLQKLYVAVPGQDHVKFVEKVDGVFNIKTKNGNVYQSKIVINAGIGNDTIYSGKGENIIYGDLGNVSCHFFFSS